MRKLDKNLLFLTGLFIILLSTQLVFFFNDFVNDAIQTQVNNTLEARFGTYLFTVFLSKIMNNIIFLWVVQSVLLLLSLLIFYKTITIYFDKKTAFFSSILFMVAPYMLQLARQFLMHYVLHLFFFVMANYLLIQYLKTEDKKYSISYLLISCLGIFINNYYLLAVLSQCISLFLIGKKKLSVFTLITSFIFQLLNIAVVRWFIGYSSPRNALRFLSEIPGFSNLYHYLLFKLNIYFKALGGQFFILLFLLVIFNIKQFPKLTKKKFILVNLIATFILTSSIFIYMEEHGNILPAARYFIFFSYWLTLLAGYLVKTSKSKTISLMFYAVILFTIFSNIMETIEYSKSYLGNREQGRVFENIYQNFEGDYVVIHSDKIRYANEWVPLSRYGFTELFYLSSIPNRDISLLTRYMDEEYPMVFGGNFSSNWLLVTNGVEYNNFFVFSNNVKFTDESRLKFTKDLINSLKKNNQNFILVLNCCESDLENYPMQGLKKSIMETTVIYVYET